MVGNRPARIGSTFAAAAVISTVLVAPLLFLDLRQHTLTSPRPSDYAALFGLLWVLPVAFVMIVMPVGRAFRSGDTLLRRPSALAVRIVLLVLVAAMWLRVVSDQMPCFMGIPNCD